MIRIQISKDAERELEEAALWYELESPGLGSQLIDAFQQAIHSLQQELLPIVPVNGSASAKGAKRIILRRFPFSIILVKRLETLIVVAFAHHSMKPGYWRGRLKN